MMPAIPVDLISGWDDRSLFRRDPDKELFRVCIDLDTVEAGTALDLLRQIPARFREWKFRPPVGRTQPGQQPAGRSA